MVAAIGKQAYGWLLARFRRRWNRRWLQELILHVLDRCRAARPPCCLHGCLPCGAPDHAAEMPGSGLALVTFGSDARFVEAAAAAAAAAAGSFRRIVGGN